MLFHLLIHPSVSSSEDEKMSFVGWRQPTPVEMKRVCDGGGLGGGGEQKEGGWET